MIEYYVETPVQGFYFDRIHINTFYDPTMMRNILPVGELEKECNTFGIKEPTDKAVELGSKSRIEMIAPSKEALGLLRKAMEEANLSYFITKIEITKDIFTGSPNDAEANVTRKASTLRRKKSTNFFVFDARWMPVKSGYGEGLFADCTYYYGTEINQFVMYARYSKINGRPCMHEEWCFTSRSRIEKKAGLRTIDDLINSNFETFFKKEERHFVHEKIDSEKFLRWYTGCKQKENLDSKEQKIGDILGQRLYGGGWFENPAAFVSKFANVKREIRKKPGPKTGPEKEYLAMEYTHFLIRLNQEGEEE